MTLLTILHTNDLHGRVHQLPRITTISRQVRAEVEANGGFCVLWDIGDAEDPTLFESRMTKGSAMLSMLRAAGYDQAVLGNATPIRYGPQAVQGLADAFGQPLLCANMLDPDRGEPIPGLVPYTILSFGKSKIGVIGMTAAMQGYSFFPVRMLDPVRILPEWIAQVRSLGARTVLLLSHLGSDVDRQVAAQVSGLAAIIGGHDHKSFNPPLVVNETIIAQAGEYGECLGRLDLDIDLESGKVTHHRGSLIPLDDGINPAMDVQWAIEKERGRVSLLIHREIGVLADPVDWAEDRQCAAGCLLADAILDRVKDAEVAIVLAGHWNSGLEAGPVSIGRLYDAVRSTANPARVELTGEQILRFLVEGHKPENASRRPRPLRGVAHGLPHVAGMRVEPDPASLGLPGVWVGGERLQPGRTYVVATTDLELSQEVVGYLDIPESDYDLEVPVIVPEILAEYIARNSPLSVSGAQRITFPQS
jgi:2',3'-cyclic-nucleotide 2'-phosphodiesterase (5'-nucleotidase family)